MNMRPRPHRRDANVRRLSWTVAYAVPYAVACAVLLALPACDGPADRHGTRARDAVTSAAVIREPAPSQGSLYSLTSAWRDQSGRRMQFSDLAGTVAVITMVYTSCTATCPLVVAELRRIEHGLTPAQRAQVRFVLVSLDPDRDQPERLSTWAASHQLDPSRWILLAGSDGSVRELAAIIDVRYQRQASGEIAHSNGFTVIGPSGRILASEPGLGHADRLLQVVTTAVVATRTTLHPPTLQPIEQ